MGKRSSKYTVNDQEDINDSTRPKYYTWVDYLMAMDMYGAKPEFEVRGKKRVKSCWGAFISFLAGVFIFTYFAYKLLYFMQNIILIRKFLELLT